MGADGFPALFLEPEAFSDWAIREAASRYGLAAGPGQVRVLFVRVGRRLDGRLLELMPKLRVVVSVTTGVDHIDHRECRRRGIEVLTLQGERSFLQDLANTSELAFALLLALYRRLLPASRDVLSGIWTQAPHRGFSLQNRTFGVVGYGRLGRIAARIAGGFGMRVLAYDPLAPEPESGVRQVDKLTDLAGQADVLSLHADLNDANYGMIDRKILNAMPAHAVLINTARGQLVDEQALLQALESRSIAGAALDVVRDEDRFDADNLLVRYARGHDNLLLTPHIGGQTYEAVEAADKFMLSKLKNWCADNVD